MVMRSFTTREVAEFIGSEEWRVRRLFETGAIPEPSRFAGKRVIPPQLIPRVVNELQRRGWLPENEGSDR